MTKIPSFSDVLHSFGFELATVREPRLTQSELANAMTLQAAKERLALESDRDDRKEEMQEKLKAVTTAISEQGVVSKVDALTVRAWENGTQFPNETQYKYIKEVLQSVAPLSADEENRLDSAYSTSKAAAKRGNKTEHFGTALSAILFDRMNSEPASIANHKEFATYIQMVAPSDSLEKLQSEKAKLETAISDNEHIPTKGYFIVDGEGKKESLLDKEGYLKISGEHIRMIEHGIIPSGDLLDLMHESLNNAKPLESNERNDLSRQYNKLTMDASQQFDEMVRRKLIDSNPLSVATNATVAPAQMNVPESEKKAPVQAIAPQPEKVIPFVAPQTPVVKAPAAQASAPVAPVPQAVIPEPSVTKEPVDTVATTDVITISSTGPSAVLEANTPAVSHTPTYVYQPYTPLPSLQPSNSSSTNKLAEAYSKIFSAFGLKAPNDATLPTTRQDNSAGARAELARKLGLSRGDIPELRPFSLKPLSDEVKKAIIRQGNAIAMTQLVKNYDDAVASIVSEIQSSPEAEKLAEAVEGFETMLREDQEHKKFKDMYKYNNVTEIPQKDSEDYFRHGGIGMTEARGIEEVLTAVNSQWFKDSPTRHNVMRHKGDQTAWRKEVKPYIKAHQAVRSLRELLQQRFEHNVGLYEDQRNHEVAQLAMAKELAELRITHQFASSAAGKDLKMDLFPDQRRRMAELAEIEATDPEFAKLVVEATHTKQNLPASGKYTQDASERAEVAAAAGNNR